MLTFPKFYLHKYRFNIEAVEDIRLPFYKGFMLRGVLGRSLKKIVCIDLNRDCKNCIVKDKCIYVYLFETIPSKEIPDSHKYSDYPRPYVIIPPQSCSKTIKEGEGFSFDIVLIGKAFEYLPYIILAYEEIGKIGFRNQKGRFGIKNVECVDINRNPEEIYSNSRILGCGDPVTFDLIMNNIPDDTDEITITFETPLRLEIKGELVDTPPSFGTLIEALLRRTILLNYLHCGGDFIQDYSKYLADTEKVSIESSKISWLELKRYSNRHKKEMFQGGIVGTVKYKGEIQKYIPLLCLGEYINAGKSTTMGLGKYRIEYNNNKGIKPSEGA